tara:strand:+ start:16895 stop:17923 length:1029 start_codon:yes stop_codon:yes gene_type:complete
LANTDKKFPAYARKANELDPAGNPLYLPRQAWWRVLKRVAAKFGSDNLAVIAAGCSFFTLLALVPLLSAIVLIYGLLADASEAANLVQPLFAVIPGDAATFLRDRLTEVAASSESALGVGLAISVAVAVWSSANAMRAVLNALNIVYDEQEKRTFLGLNLRIFGFTLSSILLAVSTQLFLSILPAVLSAFGYQDGLVALINVVRWPLLALMFMGATFVLYRRAPSRSLARWNWVLPGAVFATLAWLAASGLFSIYVSNFANFNAVYGSFGALIVLLLWLHWTYLIVLLGAEMNSELEREVIPDTTTGTPEPLGQRGAVVADSVALRPDLSHEENARSKEEDQ